MGTKPGSRYKIFLADKRTCFSNSRLKRLRRWNWDGERIIHESIVPSSRPVVMQQKGWYDIDVREFFWLRRIERVRVKMLSVILWR
jgi:hypothetical protein